MTVVSLKRRSLGRALSAGGWFLVAVLGQGPAFADLVDLDLFEPEDQLATRDTDTGLDWLDLTATATGQQQIAPNIWGFTFPNYNDIVANVGGWTADGWRHATASEICNLLSVHAIAPSPCPGGEGSVPSPVEIGGWRNLPS